MISLVTGKIGSGKTLYCVGMIVKHLSKGLTVYTNIPLNFEEIAKYVRKNSRRIIVEEQLQYVDLVNSAEWHKVIKWGSPGHPVLVLWDEIHLFFNARDWAKTQSLHRDMLSFLSQSRKTDTDVVFIAQVASTLEKQFRVQCEWEYYCRKIKDIPVPLFGTLPINRMLLVQKDCESDKPISRSMVMYDRRLFPCYDTRSFLDAQMREAALTAERIPPRKLQRVPLVDKVSLIAGCIAIALIALGFWYS